MTDDMCYKLHEEIETLLAQAKDECKAVSMNAKQFGCIPLVALVNPDISDRALRLYGLLAVRNAAGIAVGDLGEALSWSVRKVRYASAELLKIGAIQISQTRGGIDVYRTRPDAFFELWEGRGRA